MLRKLTYEKLPTLCLTAVDQRTVSDEIVTSLTCSAHHLRRPWRFPVVLSSDASPHPHWLPAFTITMTESADPMLITPALLLRLGIKVSQLHRPKSCGPSPGKTRPLSPPTYLYYRYQLHGDYWISPIFGSSSLHNGLLERFTTRLGGGFD